MGCAGSKYDEMPVSGKQMSIYIVGKKNFRWCKCRQNEQHSNYTTSKFSDEPAYINSLTGGYATRLEIFNHLNMLGHFLFKLEFNSKFDIMLLHFTRFGVFNQTVCHGFMYVIVFICMSNFLTHKCDWQEIILFILARRNSKWVNVHGLEFCKWKLT